MTKRTTSWSLAAIIGAGLSLTAIPTADAQTTWRMHSQFNEARPEARWIEEFAANVRTKTDGQLIIEPYHGGSLGLSDADILRTLPSGAVEIVMTIAENLGRDGPEIAFIYNTGMIKDDHDHFQVEPVLREIYAEFFDSRDIEMIGVMQPTLFPLNVMCRDKPVASLDALRGLKLRVFSRTLADTFAEFGVAAQIIPQNEMYVAMQTGVVDCAVYGYNSARTISLNEVANYASFFGTYAAAPYPVLVNRQAWNRLSAEHQAAVKAALDEMTAKTRALATDVSLEDEARAQFEAGGFTVLDPFPVEDQEALQRASFEVANRVAEQSGPAVTANLQRVLEGLGL